MASSDCLLGPRQMDAASEYVWSSPSHRPTIDEPSDPPRLTRDGDETPTVRLLARTSWSAACPLVSCLGI